MRPEQARSFPVPGTWAYPDSLSVEPGQRITFHVSTPAAFDLSVLRLGSRALLDPCADDEADIADAEVLFERRHGWASQQRISPGSYVFVAGDPVPDRPFTAGIWLRLWRSPCIDTLQWQWSGLITDFDYPAACRFALLVDHAGRPGVYVGDGGQFRTEWLHTCEADLGPGGGSWHHLAATVDGGDVSLFADGVLAGLWPAAAPPSGELSAAARLRIGASAEAGRANNFLDGDIARPFVARSVLDLATARRIFADRARSDLTSLGVTQLEGDWALAEEVGVRVADRSGRDRHGEVVNRGTWQVGGPAFDAARGTPGYVPERDPDRGHGLRLASDDLLDCEWEATDAVIIPSDAASGIYAARVALAGNGEVVTAPFVVVRTRPRRPGSVAVLCATNTWHAYGRIPRDEIRIPGLTASFYTRHLSGRPFFWVGLRQPIPRADPFGFESARAARNRHSHLVRPERYAHAWLRQEGYSCECITDLELHSQPGLLERFRALMICGHNEYWSHEMRAAVAAYLDRGGRVIGLSGNTLYWRVSIGAEGSIESRKTSRDGGEWLPPDEWGERWHSDDRLPGGTWALIGEPAHEVLGLEMQGMIDDGTPAAFAAYTVTQPDHFLLHSPEEVPLTAAGTFGEINLNGPKASGYEMDAAPATVGVAANPPGMVVIASALGQRLIEPAGPDPDHGADFVYWARPGGGEVVNAGSIAFTGSLAVDQGSSTLMRNVLAHFGVSQTS
ncbi:MAG: N,N-dimethylformamidase beta subunit family domain-containing protein [Streptosporangiaceae bacterium]